MARKSTDTKKPARLLDYDGLLSSADVAGYLGVEVHTLDHWASRGGGPPFIRIGKFRRYVPGDVQAYIDAQRREGGDAA